jgi:nucleoside 2-deoxyribosyltransferase
MPWLTQSNSRGRLYVGKTLREGPKALEELSRFFHQAGYTVYMPYDDDTKVSPSEIRSKDVDAIRSCDTAVLELRETSLGVAQELGAARALNKPVVLITESDRVLSHNWIRGDPGVRCCRSKEEALDLLESSVPPISELSVRN